MTIVSFTIVGNQQTSAGNPLPYLRMTQGEIKLMRIPDCKLGNKSGLAKKQKIKRYLDWKEYVRSCCYCYGLIDGRRPRPKEIDDLTDGKRKVQLDCKIYFANRAHGDPENIRKGIQDALFVNDKYVVGCVDYDYDVTRPRTEVTITRST